MPTFQEILGHYLEKIICVQVPTWF